MNRRHLLWLGIPLLVLGIVVATWFWMSQRDADFVVVGPRTLQLRDHIAILDSTIDAADFHDCKTVGCAISRLNIFLPMGGPEFLLPQPFSVEVDEKTLIQNGAVNDLLNSPIEISAQSAPMTMKQFLRMTFSKCGAQEISFIVHTYGVQVTTAKKAQTVRAQYLDSVSTYDRMRNLWKEMTGDLADNPPPPWQPPDTSW